MPRTQRVISGTGIYHIMMRGINHQDIFHDSADYNYFLSVMRRTRLKKHTDNRVIGYNCNYYAYCLMSNHIHLLIQEGLDTVSNIVKRITISYVYYYNHKYQRDGHLFKERFRSEPVNDMAYFTMLLRYIHRNPVEAQLVEKVADYPFSSWAEYCGVIRDDLRICNTKSVLRRISFHELEEMVDSPLPDGLHCLY